MLREDVAAVFLGQISHFLPSLSVCSEHTVVNLTRKALVVKAASAVPTLLWGSLPLLCQNWERLCISSSRHHPPERGSGQGNVSWGGQHQVGSGCRRWWMAAVDPFQMFFPACHCWCFSDLETMEDFSTWLGWRMVGVSQVVLVALQHPWGSTGGIEEWIGMVWQDGGSQAVFPTVELSHRGMGELSALCWVVCSQCWVIARSSWVSCRNQDCAGLKTSIA